MQVILLSQDYVGAERTLYQFIESATEDLTSRVLGDACRKVTFVKGQAATLNALVAALGAAAAGSGIEAVDLLFTTHGTTDRVVLAEGKLPEAKVPDALLGLPASA